MKKSKTSYQIEMPAPVQTANDKTRPPQLRTILARHAQRQNLNHYDMLNLHKEGFNHLRTLYLSDGTMLSDMGGSTLVQHPDNRLAVVFNHNPDKVRRVEVEKTALNDNGHVVQCSELASTDGLIVLEARECDKRGLIKDWVSEAVITHNNLVSDSTAYHGLLKRTGDAQWASESMSYELVDPTKKETKALKQDGKPKIEYARLCCGYGMGLMAENVSEQEKIQKKLWQWKKKLARDTLVIRRDRAYKLMQEHYETVAPKVIQGYTPHHVTFKDGYETEFSKRVRAKKHVKGVIGKVSSYVGHSAYMLSSYVVGALFLIASGVVKTIRGSALKSTIRSAPGAIWQFMSRKGWAYAPAAGIAMVFFAAYFLSNAMANAKQQQIWTIKNKDDVSNSFYKYSNDPEAMARRYQLADAQKMEECRALDLFDYDCVPADVTAYDDEPEFYSLNRLLSTKSVREGSLMEAFRLNGYDIGFYDEANGIRRVVIPDLKTAFVSHVGSKKEALEVSEKQEEILNMGEVIKVCLDPKTRKIKKQVMKYSDYEHDILQITAQYHTRALCQHPEHEAYLEAKKQQTEDKKIINRVKRRLKMS